MKYLDCEVTFNVYETNPVKFKSDCIAMDLINKGSNPININSSLPLDEDQSLSISPPQGYIIRTSFNGVFDTSGEGTSRLVVIRILPKNATSA